MNKNILICIEQLGSGGVETAVINKSIAYIKKGYTVFIAAKKGIYVEKLREYGITWIDFDFSLENRVSTEKIKALVEIIKKYDIGQIHSHHFPCLIYVGLAAIITNTPYNVFIHAETIDVYNWFINNYDIYRILLKMLVRNAYKIVAITNKAADNNKQYFDITDNSKYIIEKNSLNFDQYVVKREVQEINNFLIVSRLAEGKITSVKNGIDLFIEYAKEHTDKELKLEIVGDGSLRKELEDYVKEKNSQNLNIFFAGESNNIPSYIEKSDVVIGIGRCVLEGIAMKRIAIISGVDELKDLIDEKNIEDAITSNFTGKAPMYEDGTMGQPMRPNTIKEIVSKLSKLEIGSINRITNYNYDYAFKHSNVMNNSYCIDNIDISDNLERILNVFDLFNQCATERQKLVQENNNMQEKLDKSIEEKNNCEKIYNKKIEELQNENTYILEKLNQMNNDYQDVCNELHAVISSKRWKLTSKFIDPVKKIKLKIGRKNNAK